MSPRLLLSIIPAALAAGCASGEPVQPLERALSLGESEPTIIDTELVVEVSADGVPIVADAVWLWDGESEAADAHCMIHRGLGQCQTWFAEMEAEGPLTVFAEVCGELYSQPLAFSIEPGADSFAFSSHISIEADATQCGRTVPQTCADQGTEPALLVSTVDDRGDAVAVSDVQIEWNDTAMTTADCLEGPGRGCTEWASQHMTTGRYRASVEVCGETFTSEWLNVFADDSGCKAISETIALVVDPKTCRYAG